MTGPLKRLQPRRRKLTVGIVGLLCASAAAGLVGVTLAKTFTLRVAQSGKVVDASTGAVTHESIVTTSRGLAVYVLTGDSRSSPECTSANGCFKFWPPVKVASPTDLSKASGVPYKLGIFHRDGFFQVTLGGHPLYRYAGDHQAAVANGQHAHGFGGTWHVIKIQGSGGGTTTTPATTTSTTSTTTSTTTTSTTAYGGGGGGGGW
jgi:predicted lipoprotein with Yx(FWY)xxD motif